MLKKAFLTGFILFLGLHFGACASRENVADSYGKVIKDQDVKASARTTLFFLIDGLPSGTLSTELNEKHLPAIHHYFLAGKKQFTLARVPFPSLTYPSITSLLTERPVDQNGIFGNQILKDDKVLNFESVSSYSKLNKLIEGKNIFSRLKEKGLRSVSFDYIFHADSTAHTSTDDINAGLDILEKSYSVVDKKTIAALQILLTENPPNRWPDFIFIHLIGVDFLSHDDGPKSPHVKRYLEMLDEELEPIFNLLSKAEKNHQVVSLLSADHGFDKRIKSVLKLKKVINTRDSKIRILDEGRYLGLYFPPTWSPEQKARFLDAQVQSPYIDLVAYREGPKVFVRSQSLKATVLYNSGECFDSGFKISVLQEFPALLQTTGTQWTCPDQLDTATNNLFYPYFILNISHYFQAKDSPDAIILSKPGVAFNSKYAGQHGGPTPQETFVPVLFHGAQMGNPARVPALWELLKFL